MNRDEAVVSCLVFMNDFPNFPGFGDRLLSEVKKLAPKDIKIRVSLLALSVIFNKKS